MIPIDFLLWGHQKVLKEILTITGNMKAKIQQCVNIRLYDPGTVKKTADRLFNTICKKEYFKNISGVGIF